jgi:hypothetical protein
MTEESFVIEHSLVKLKGSVKTNDCIHKKGVQ